MGAKVIWKPIKGYEDRYLISNTGKIKNLKGHYLSLQNRKNTPYLFVGLFNSKGIHSLDVHRLVALTFVDNPYPEKYTCVNHMDENPKNNNADNLEWCTQKYNVNYGHHSERLSKSNLKGLYVIFKDGTDMYFRNERLASEYFNKSVNYFRHWVSGYRNNTLGLSFERGDE